MVYKKQSTVIAMHNFNLQIPKFYVLIGIPCSGKSHYAKKYLESERAVIISTDDIRKEYRGTRGFYKEDNSEIFDIAMLRIKDELLMKNNIVFDATNTNKKNRKKIIDLGKKCNSKIIAVVMLTPLNVCIRRNRQRDYESRVSEEVIYNYNKANLNIDYSEGFDEILNIKYPF